MTSIIFQNSPKQQMLFNFLNWHVSLVHLVEQKITAVNMWLIIHQVYKSEKWGARPPKAGWWLWALALRLPCRDHAGPERGTVGARSKPPKDELGGGEAQAPPGAGGKGRWEDRRLQGSELGSLSSHCFCPQGRGHMQSPGIANTRGWLTEKKHLA